MDAPAADDPLHIAALAKGLQLLDAFDGDPAGLGLSELARRTGLGKSAAQRLAHTLFVEGWLERDPATRRFRPALRCLNLAYAYLRTDALVAVAMPTLIDLARRLGETINMAELEGSDIVYVARLPCQRTQVAATLVGRRVPALNTSSGRAMLGTLSPAERRAAIETWPVGQWTSRTTTDRARLTELVEEAAAHGYAVSDSELIVHEIGVAAPIIGPGRPGALHCSLSGIRWTRERIDTEIAPLLLDAASALAAPAPPPR